MYDITASNAFRLIRERSGLTQRDFAARVGTSQSAVARLERGDANPTLDTLERTAAAAGFAIRITLVPLPVVDPVVERYKQDVDRTLLRENLRKSVDERIRSLDEWQETSAALQRAVKAARVKQK